MSVLDQPSPVQLTMAERTANQLRQNARRTFIDLVQTYTDGARLFWQNPDATPQDVAAALGTDGAELFQLHAKIGQLLAEIKPESVTEGLSVVGQFSISEDGVITVLEQSPAE